VVVRAAQAGDARFEAALDVTVSFEVTAATVNVFFGNVTAPGTGGASPKVGDIAAALPPNSNRGSLLVVAPAVSKQELVLAVEQVAVEQVIQQV
jgi:hypothetical protein